VLAVTKASFSVCKFPVGTRPARETVAGRANALIRTDLLIAACLLFSVLFQAVPAHATGCGAGDARPGQSLPVPHLQYQVTARLTHDRNAFTQGLVFYKGFLYESTGLLGESSLRRIELPSGKVVQTIPLPSNRFGEGLAVLGGRFVQLTWRSGEGFIYEPGSLRQTGSFSFAGEGWGSTTIADRLLVSDGSAMLTYLDMNDMTAVSTLAVTEYGKPVEGLNELEYVDGFIYANVWPGDCIAQIDPDDGQVVAWLDLSALFPPEQRPNEMAVTNGIAYDPGLKRWFVTGKYWPYIYQIRMQNPAPDKHVAYRLQPVAAPQ
jgi:glutamine cyclotransferase